MEVNPSSCSVSFQDDTNIDAAITCLVKSIMSLEEERATADAAGVKHEPDNSVLVLPRFNYSKKERGLGGCSGCSSLKPRRWVCRREEECVWCALKKHFYKLSFKTTLYGALFKHYNWLNSTNLVLLHEEQTTYKWNNKFIPTLFSQ